MASQVKRGGRGTPETGMGKRTSYCVGSFFAGAVKSPHSASYCCVANTDGTNEKRSSAPACTSGKKCLWPRLNGGVKKRLESHFNTARNDLLWHGTAPGLQFCFYRFHIDFHITCTFFSFVDGIAPHYMAVLLCRRRRWYRAARDARSSKSSGNGAATAARLLMAPSSLAPAVGHSKSPPSAMADSTRPDCRKRPRRRR